MAQPSFPHNKGKVLQSVSKDNMLEKLEPRSQVHRLVMEVCPVSLWLFLSRGDLQGDKRLQATKGT